MRWKQTLMTRTEFDTFLGRQRIPIMVAPPYDLVPCGCGDVNCHGWRLLELRPTARRELAYVPEPTYA
jgi:hypothetical protein